MISRLLVLTCTLVCWCADAVAEEADLPRDSSELIRKLDEFAKQERAKAETAIAEKSKSVIPLLQQQLTRETTEGNPEAALAIRAELEKLGVVLTDAPPQKPGRRMRIPKDAKVFGGHSYQIIPYSELDEEDRNWHGAKEAREKLGGHLAIVDSGAEHGFAAALSPDTHMWLGASCVPDGKPTSVWRWVDESRLNQAFGGGRIGEEELAANSYLRLFRGTWAAYRIDSPFIIAFLCEWDGVRPGD